jgi:hypothetical protein
MILSAFLKSVVAGAGVGMALFGFLDLVLPTFPDAFVAGLKPEAALNYSAIIGGVAGALIGVVRPRLG